MKYVCVRTKFRGTPGFTVVNNISYDSIDEAKDVLHHMRELYPQGNDEGVEYEVFAVLPRN